MAYLVHLNQFNGPLDLLLHLIEKAEVDIKDIFVSEITSQYIEYMQQLDDLDLDTASEFISMAATLLYIKSRSMLPPVKREKEDQEDPEALLIRQLREYKEFKEASRILQGLQEASRGIFSKLPEESVFAPAKVELTGVAIDELFNIFLEVIKREKKLPVVSPIREVRKDQYNIVEKIEYLRNLLQNKKKSKFSELFNYNPPIMEIIVTFMALLELAATGELTIEQKNKFGEIHFEEKLA